MRQRNVSHAPLLAATPSPVKSASRNVAPHFPKGPLSGGSFQSTLAAHPLAKRGRVTISVLVGAGHYFQESCAETQFMRAQMERDVGLVPGRNPYVLLPLRNTSWIGGAD